MRIFKIKDVGGLLWCRLPAEIPNFSTCTKLGDSDYKEENWIIFSLFLFLMVEKIFINYKKKGMVKKQIFIVTEQSVESISNDSVNDRHGFTPFARLFFAISHLRDISIAR